MKLGRIVKPLVLQVVNQIYDAPGKRRGQPVRPRSLRPAAGRNDPCLCGSGRKYKHCCRGRSHG